MRYWVEYSTYSIILCTHVLFFMYLIDEACHKSELWVNQSENTLTAGSNCRNGKLMPSCVFLALKSILCSKLQQVFSSKMNISMARFKAWSWGVPTLTYCSSESTKRKNDKRGWLISHYVSRATSWQKTMVHASCLKISFEIRIMTTKNYWVLLCQQLVTPPHHFMWHWRWLLLGLPKCHLWVALHSPEKSMPVPNKSKFSSILVIWHIIATSRNPYSLVTKCINNVIGGPNQQQQQTNK